MKRKVLIVSAFLVFVLFVACNETAPVQLQPTEEPVHETVIPIEADVDEVTIPVTELIVSSPDDMPDTETFAKMTSLRLLDLTALPYTSYTEIAEIEKSCPECQIIWNQMLTDGIFRSDSVSLTLPNATEEDINLLNVFSKLAYVDASGSTAYEALYAFRNTHPDVAVHYTMNVGDVSIDENSESLIVPPGADAKELMTNLKAFDRIAVIDLRSSGWDEEAVRFFINEYPEIRIMRMIRLGDQVFDSETEMLDLRSFGQANAETLISELAAFPMLKSAALPEAWTESDIEKFRSAYPAISVVGPVPAFGQTIAGTAEEVDLSRTKMKDTDDVEAMLTQLPFVKKVILCDCGLSDDQMEQLCSAHPDIRFVWTIVIGKRKLRTDAVGFSTKNPSKYTSAKASDKYNESVKKAVRLHEGDIEALKYCTDLEALDLGHNYLTNNDLAVISGLTKLKVLILADNKITDISCLTTLKYLEYIELFMNRIPDLSPLCEMPSLIDINVCNTGVTDLSPLFRLTGAKRLWYAMNPFSREEAKKLKETLTDCLCNYTTNDETGEGWREDPRYQWMRSYFKDS